MNIFTIDSENSITAHASRKAAREAGGAVFDTAEELAELVGPDNGRLIEIWNSLTGVAPVKKFASRAVAARRILAQVQRLAASAAEGETKQETAVAPDSSTKKQASSGKKAEATTKPGSKGTAKKEIVLSLISRKDGASLEELMAALHWQKHSVRGFIATLGKTMRIESFKTEQGVRTYKTSSSGQK